jgi:hypothetical protein
MGQEVEAFEANLGDKRPKFLCVIRTSKPGEAKQLSQALSQTSLGADLDGAPIVILPPGCKFELYEVEQEVIDDSTVADTRDHLGGSVLPGGVGPSSVGEVVGEPVRKEMGNGEGGI